MPEKFEQVSEPEKPAAEPKQELGNFFPEVFANAPLKETSLVYSVPVMGEWDNGNLQKFLQAMFSQKIEEGKAFEIELIENIGFGIYFLREGVNTTKNKEGKVILDNNPKTDEGRRALKLLEESAKSIEFLKKIIEIQKLSRAAAANIKNKKYIAQLETEINSVSDPLLKDIAQLAAKKAGLISLAVIDATHTIFEDTEYKYPSISSFRTLGADIASARFTNPNVVMGMYDADTLPESNHDVRIIQNIFEKHPGLKYIFTGLTYTPAGSSKEFIETTPAHNILRTTSYDDSYIHGSPQIYFKLSEYEKLKEISGYQTAGFHGDEDRDTSLKLIYYLGDMQESSLLESTFYAPTAMTADRLDGSVDSAVRRADFEQGSRFLEADLKTVYDFRKKVMDFIEEEPDEKKKKILEELNEARQHFLNKEKFQQRMNKLCMRAFLKANEEGFVRFLNGEVQINEEKVLKLHGGKALLHYLRANKSLAAQVLSSPDDLKTISYYAGKGKNRPENLSAFQFSVKEYLGNVDLLDFNNLEKKDLDSSFMHSIVVEVLSLAHIYRKYFEVKEFRKYYQENPYSFNDWPEDTSKKEINYNFSDLTQRKQKITEGLDVMGSEIPISKKSWVPGLWSSPITLLARFF